MLEGIGGNHTGSAGGDAETDGSVGKGLGGSRGESGDGGKPLDGCSSQKGREHVVDVLMIN